MQRLLFTLLVISFFFTACETKTHIEPPIQEPAWIVQPSQDGNIGAVGSAQEHFKGKTAQRRLAISRALDELAQQSGVQVQSTIKRNEKRDGLHTNSSTEFYTIQNSSNKTVRAHIQESWTNPRTKEIYVWLVAD
ncbi:LPP20 family lipoprotein [Campylobacterota bacterium]